MKFAERNTGQTANCNDGQPPVVIQNAREREGMTVHAERELKFAVDRDTLRAAVTIPLQGKMTRSPLSQDLKTTYFDTDALDLMRRGLSLRVRQSGGNCTLGVKKDVRAHAGYFERDEEEAPLPSTELNLNVLGRKTSSQLREIVGEKTLEPRFGSDVRRTLKRLRFHSADIEVALDEGFVFAGKRREPTCEIELELKAGAPAALFEFGLALADSKGLSFTLGSRQLGDCTARRIGPTLSGECPRLQLHMPPGSAGTARGSCIAVSSATRPRGSSGSRRCSMAASRRASSRGGGRQSTGTGHSRYRSG